MCLEASASLLFCTFYIFIIYYLYPAYGDIVPLEKFVAGKCRSSSEWDSFIYDTTYYDCVEACRKTPACLSVSMYPLMNLCRINKDVEEVIETCPFYIFSEKRTWIKKSPSGCESLSCEINQKCEVSDSGTAECVNYECEQIHWLENGKVFGKDFRKGEKIGFVCDPGFVLKGQSSLTCQQDGSWDGDVPTCECESLHSTRTTIGYPDYESPWSYIAAQEGRDSVQYFEHHLGELPGLVEVLVKLEYGPYEGLMFKATGHADRDDDVAKNYGGVVYIYNDEQVAVTVPTNNNFHDGGFAMYMGEDINWTGGDTFESLVAMVKVRCWLPSNIPEPCFQSERLEVESGIDSTDPTYMQIAHNTCSEPVMVSVRLNMTNGRDKGWFSDGQEPVLASVRLNMTNGRDKGWFSDGQGTNRFVSSIPHGMNGGVIYGFNEKNLRVWIYSGNKEGHNLFNAVDGWGLHGVATTGILDVRVWCQIDNPLYVHDVEQIDQNTPANASEILFPQFDYSDLEDMDLFALITIYPLEGPNYGYYFNGIDSAMTPMDSASSSCSYGGLIYGYNRQKIQLRWPSQPYGGFVCIPHMYGRGINTGRVENVQVKIKIWRLVADYEDEPQLPGQDPIIPDLLGHF